MAGKVTVEYEDGKGFTANASECIVIHTREGQPRELEAMARCHDMLRGLSREEARRVVTWLYAMFPEIEIILST